MRRQHDAEKYELSDAEKRDLMHKGRQHLQALRLADGCFHLSRVVIGIEPLSTKRDR